MKLVIHKVNKEYFPEELLEPNFFLDKIENSFISDSFKEGDITYVSSELEFNNIIFFIGANNSGKSRFMRGLLKLNNEPHTYICNKKFFRSLKKDLKNLEENLNLDEKSILGRYNLRIDSIGIPNENGALSNFTQDDYDRVSNNLNKLKISIPSKEHNILEWIKKVQELIDELNFTKQNSAKNKTYIPVLRSLFSIPDLPENNFEIVISKLFFKQREDKGITINTGLGLSDDIYRIYNSRKNRDIKVFSGFLSRNFFENKKVELFADIKNEKLITIGLDGGAYRGINEIGDGIQSLLLLLFPIFTAYENDVFYIEEPETNLHPGFQRIFIETLLTNEFIVKKNLKFFFTTHSNHFLDLTLRDDKVSFFQFEKIEEGKHLIKTKIKPGKETLDLLGVNNTSVFLANTSLWVEGPTDRLYLSKLLKLYCEREDEKKPYLKEDIDFAFFEYGGNLIAHYLFKGTKEEVEEVDEKEVLDKINSFALSNKIYLFADNDNVTEESIKYSRQKNLENLANENPYFYYQNTIVKEVENLLPVKVIKEFMLILLKGKTNIEKVKGINFQRNNYEKVGLGKFYEEQFKKCGLKEADYYKFRADSGTLKADYKNKLARFVVERKYTYKHMIEDNDVLKKLIENLYKFITEKKK